MRQGGRLPRFHDFSSYAQPAYDFEISLHTSMYVQEIAFPERKPNTSIWNGAFPELLCPFVPNSSTAHTGQDNKDVHTVKDGIEA